MALFKEQMDKYDECLQEMRKLNLKNIESAQGVQQLADQANEKLGQTVGEVEAASVSRIQQTSDLSVAGINNASSLAVEGIKQTSDLSIAGIKQTSDLSIAGINRTVDESLAKIAVIQENAGNIEEITETMAGIQTKQEELFKSLEDFLHTDNVKVYRNVQAAMIEELGKQTTELKEAQEKNAKSNKIILPFMIITMIVSLANLAVLIARVLGLV